MSTIHRITAEEFERMSESGVFQADSQRIELIAGALRDMSPPGPMHDEIVERFSAWSHDHRATRFRVRTQSAIGLPELESIPLPDVVWARRRNYALRRPEADDIYLIVEVSDSTLGYDRLQKSILYAAAGIQDYWIVNIPERSVEVYRQPAPNGYACMVAHEAEPDTLIRPLHFPDLALSVAELFKDRIDESV